MWQLKILVLNPVSTTAWDELTLAHVGKVVSPGVLITVGSLARGPPAIEYECGRDLAAPYVVEEVIRASREGFHAIAINCFDDPGLKASREVSGSLVPGIRETSLAVTLLLGYRIAIISTGRCSRVVYYRRVAELGLGGRVVYATGIEVGVLDLRK